MAINLHKSEMACTNIVAEADHQVASRNSVATSVNDTYSCFSYLLMHINNVHVSLILELQLVRQCARRIHPVLSPTSLVFS